MNQVFVITIKFIAAATLFHGVLLWNLSKHWSKGVIYVDNVDRVRHIDVPIVVDVTDYGVVGDGIHDDTKSMQYMFNTVIPLKRKSLRRRDSRSDIRVVVMVPQRCVVLCGPVIIQSINYVTLQIDGRLQAWDITSANGSNKTRLDVWPMIEPLITYGNSRDQGLYQQYQSLIYINNATNIRITGTGVIDGDGQPWWDIIIKSQSSSLLRAGRPNLIQILHSSDIEIDTVTLQNSPFWTVHPVLSQYIYIHHVTIMAPLYSPNVDGIDPDSCQHVLIEYVHIECGDDHIAIKAGVCGTSSPNNCSDAIWASGKYRTDNVTVQHSTFGRGMGIAIGSEMSGGIKNVLIYNNTIGLCTTGASGDQGCGWGPALHIKTTIARGGYVQNIVFANNTVWNTSMFILLEIGYQTSRNELPPATYAATKVHDIAFVSNKALGSATSATFFCSMYDLCHNITIIDNHILIPPNSHENPWNCHFVADDYFEARNDPPGLDECLVNATMNISSEF